MPLRATLLNFRGISWRIENFRAGVGADEILGVGAERACFQA